MLTPTSTTPTKPAQTPTPTSAPIQPPSVRRPPPQNNPAGNRPINHARRTLPELYKPPVPLHGRALRTCRGLVIGGAIVPAAPAISGDAELIQLALLEPRTAQQPRLVNRIAGAVWRWC